GSRMFRSAPAAPRSRRSSASSSAPRSSADAMTARSSQYDGPPLVYEQVLLSPRAATPFSLTVDRGETVVVLGEEVAAVGALGPLALALEIPRAGHVRVLGTDPALPPDRERLAFRRQVGYLPAGDGLMQNLSLRDNVALPLRFG